MRYLAAALLVFIVPNLQVDAQAQDVTEGRNALFKDPFIENLVGDWTITRQMRGKQVQNSLKAEWVLNHQFLQLHMKDVANPPAYEALVMIGYNHADERYVAHWCDVYGGKFSAMGYGKREGDAIEFAFQYPDGPFFNTFTWIPATKSWTMRLESQGSDGKREVFAIDDVRRH